VALVVHGDPGRGGVAGVGERDHRRDPVLDADAAPAPRRAEDQGLAVRELERGLDARLLVLHLEPLVVVVDGAVLEDLDEGRAAVLEGAPQHLLQMRRVDVDGARHEGRARAEREGDRVDRVVDRAVGVDLVFMPTREVGEYWPLVRP